MAHLAKMGEIESVKAVSDLYSPVSGAVPKSTDALPTNPNWSTATPSATAGCSASKMNDPSELDTLLDAAAYAEYLAGL